MRDYDTELKRKMFKTTPEGKDLLNKLNAKKKDIMNSSMYYVFPFRYAGYGKEYNLETKTFDLSYQMDWDDFYPIQGYMNIEQLVFKCPSSVKQYWKERKHSDRYYYYNTLKLPMTESQAFPIETNRDNMALVIEFKYYNGKWNSRQAAIFNIRTLVIQGICSNIYIIDKNSKEIYYSLLPIKSTISN